MNSCELAAYISTIACTIFKQFDKDDVAVMAAAFAQLGDTLSTMLIHEEVCNKQNDDV